MSLRGRITIAKTKLISQIIYISTVLTPKTATIAEIQTLINNFVMGIESNSKHWISKETIYSHTTKGGFGMILARATSKQIYCSFSDQISSD